MIDRLCIAVDGSDAATTATRRGLALADAFDAAVDVVHCVPRATLQLLQSDHERAQLRERGEAILVEVAALAAEADRTVTTHLVEGRPAAQLREQAAATGADLLVVGRQGTTGLGKRLLGGVTERVIRGGTVPVLVVPGAAADPPAGDYSRVLVLTDGSEIAEQAAPWGATIARAAGASVHVLNVVDLQAAGGAFNAGGLETAVVDRLAERGEAAVDRIANQVGETAPDVDVCTAVERTSGVEGVAPPVRDYVATNDIDLVVMGSQGRSNLDRHLFGSVAGGVLRTVDIPVLVVPRPT